METNKRVDTRLSYSSAQLIQNCEQKYMHYKVLGTPKDLDASDSTEAFDIGKAFHQYLEDSLHSELPEMDEQIARVCKEFHVEHQFLMIKAMLKKYLLMHTASGLEVAVCEPQINDPTTIGFIDVILFEPATGAWWVTDLKTSGRFMPSIAAKLPKDYQLNLYSKFAGRIAAALNLDPDNFAGCRYRVTTKTTTKRKGGESDEAYYRRLFNAVQSYDLIVPKETLDIEGTWELHQKNHARSMELRNGAEPKKNFSNCESYFKPCEYWSHCHGSTNTKCQSLVQIKTADDYEAANELANFI